MTPNWAYDILRKDPNHKDREVLEQTISESAEYSCLYARNVIKGRWELGEAAISKDADASYYYAKEVIGGRFELGEAAISQEARSSYEYARYVISGRFELGEAAISKDALYSYCYARDVIKGRLPTVMHNKMIVFGMIDSSDKYVKRYLDYIGSKKYCTLKGKDTKNESRTSV